MHGDNQSEIKEVGSGWTENGRKSSLSAAQEGLLNGGVQ